MYGYPINRETPMGIITCFWNCWMVAHCKGKRPPSQSYDVQPTDLDEVRSDLSLLQVHAPLPLNHTNWVQLVQFPRHRLSVMEL